MPEDVKLIAFALAARFAPRVNAPVLLIVTAPVPLCVITPVVNAAPLVKEIIPVPLLVAAKPETLFAFVNVVPKAELVVSNPPPVNKPPVPSVIAPAVPVSVMPPVDDIVAPVTVTLRPASAVNKPEPLVTLLFTNTSLVVPFAVNVIVPVVAAFIRPLTVNVPALVIPILPPPVSLIALVVNAALLFSVILPLVVFVAVKLVTILLSLNVVPPTEDVVKPLLVVTMPAV